MSSPKLLSRHALLSAGLTTALWSAAASAQVPPPAAEPAETRLEDVIVAGDRERESPIAVNLQQFGNQVQLINAEDIAAGGYTNFAELASGLIKGANVGYSEDESEFTIRLDGGGDRDTLVVLDGVPLYDRGPGVEEIWGATLIDPHMIESVEVFRGGQSLYFGSNAGIGLVSIRTKKPKGEQRVGEMAMSYGSFDTRELWGNYSFPIDADGKHSVMFYGGYTASDAPKIFRDQDMTDNHRAAGGIQDYSYSRDNVGAKYLWTIDETTQLLANAQFLQTDFQDTFPNTTISGPTIVKMPLINLSFDKTWSSWLKSAVTASWRRPQLENTKFLPEVCRIRTGCVDPTTPSRTTAWGRWTGRFVPQAFEGVGTEAVIAGFQEYVFTALNTITFNPSISAVVGFQSTNYRNDSDARVRISDEWVSDNALILDLHLTPSFSPRTNLSLAGRVDHEKSFGTETIGKFGLKQGFPGGFYLRANGGTSYSLPKTNELFANTETVVGNPDLKPEETKTLNYGFGIDRPVGMGNFSAEVGGFSTDIDNRIETTSGLTPNTRFNRDRTTEIRGIVADTQYRINSNWNFSVSYTKQEATYAGSTTQIDAIPEWFMVGTLNWSSDARHYHFTLNPRLQGPTWVASPAVGGVKVPGLADYNYGDWLVVNATAQYWMGDDLEHRFSLRLVNILGEEYGNRAGWGNQQYGSAGIRGEVTTTQAGYYYPYTFYAKPRSAFLTYSYRF
ncbi:MAG: TonB-dependent receptor plug domain-containing protein [Steroidobacteraceae bacterium]